MAEETFDDYLTRGHWFDGSPFALDLYRLLAMVLGDQRIARLGYRLGYHHPPVWQLQERFRKVEVTRILVSSAVALRILFDQHPTRFRKIKTQSCGSLWQGWRKGRKFKPEVLTLREACNKIIHAYDVRDDVVIPFRRSNPDELGVYIRPFVYLYGTKDGSPWRAKVSIVDFAQLSASVFFLCMSDG